MKTARSKGRSLLTRLGRNEAGNTLAIVAAAVLPLAGMIGGALDISRAYLVKTRLSQACDAGVLAGRRMMGSDGTLTTDVTTEVQKFVNFNFPQGYMGTTAFTVTPTTDSNRQVILSLQTTVPTAIMRLFGKTSVAVATSCTARNDYSNIDIVLVLDTTGSMACSPTVTSCTVSTKTMTVNGRTVSYRAEQTDSSKNNISRMQALRDALSDLQTDIGKIETEFNAAPSATRKRVRWAIIPFSQMVNVGGSMGYDFGGDGSDTGSKSTLYARKPDWFNTSGKYCTDNASTSNSSYCSTVAHNSTWMTSTWDGCVEERSTSNSINSTSTYVIPGPGVTGNMPTGANDLQVALAPTSTD
ncbi:MAG TPA: TadE/TadG family type IV pilus assembly protein, partial [Sphingobium sp.]